MQDRNEIAKRILAILDAAGARYTLYDHRPVRTYDDVADVAQETSWQGTEMRTLVQKAGDQFVIYVTLQGTRADYEGGEEASWHEEAAFGHQRGAG